MRFILFGADRSVKLYCETSRHHVSSPVKRYQCKIRIKVVLLVITSILVTAHVLYSAVEAYITLKILNTFKWNQCYKGRVKPLEFKLPHYGYRGTHFNTTPCQSTVLSSCIFSTIAVGVTVFQLEICIHRVMHICIKILGLH